MRLCAALALATHEIPFSTSIASILYGSVSAVREGIEAWYDTGITTLIVVPSSTRGGQMVAFQELIDAFH